MGDRPELPDAWLRFSARARREASWILGKRAAELSQQVEQLGTVGDQYVPHHAEEMREAAEALRYLCAFCFELAREADERLGGGGDDG